MNGYTAAGGGKPDFPAISYNGQHTKYFTSEYGDGNLYAEIMMTSSGTLTVAAGKSYVCDVWGIGGGGGGGGYKQYGGGGGSGYTNISLGMTISGNTNVTIGAGGNIGGVDWGSGAGASGGTTVLKTMTCTGGGGGNAYYNSASGVARYTTLRGGAGGSGGGGGTEYSYDLNTTGAGRGGTNGGNGTAGDTKSSYGQCDTSGGQGAGFPMGKFRTSIGAGSGGFALNVGTNPYYGGGGGGGAGFMGRAGEPASYNALTLVNPLIPFGYGHGGRGPISMSDTKTFYAQPGLDGCAIIRIKVA